MSKEFAKLPRVDDLLEHEMLDLERSQVAAERES